MVTESYARSQVMRMAGLDYFPREDAAVGELVQSLSTADTEIVAWEVIDEFVQYGRPCPKPVDIRQAIYNRRHIPKTSKCAHCGGKMWITGIFLVTHHSESGIDWARNWVTKQRLVAEEQIKKVRAHLAKNQEILAGSEMCDCHPGKAEAA